MPASAVARLTPETGGMSGTCFGASGETVADIAIDPGSGLRRWAKTQMPGATAGHSGEITRAASADQFYFFGGSAGAGAGVVGAAVAGGATRSILAAARSLVIISACERRTRYCSIWSLTLSNSGGWRSRLSSTLMMCQPNCDFTGSEIA